MSCVVMVWRVWYKYIHNESAVVRIQVSSIFCYGGCMSTLGVQNPDSKIYGAITGPIWGRHDPGGPRVGPINFATLEVSQVGTFCRQRGMRLS